MTTERPRWWWAAVRLAALAAMLVVGCRSSPPMVPVSGKLTVNKKPLAHARVQFVPDRDKGNVKGEEARGRVDDSGAYTLSTGGKEGVAPGWYKVAVFAFEEPKPGEGPKPPVWLAPMKYSDPNRSGLSVEVKADAAADAYDFDLER